MKKPSVTEAWVPKSVFSIKRYNKVSINKYFQEIRPLMILQRALGRLPYSFNEQGLAPFQLLSFPALYTAVFFVVHSSWTIYTMSTIFELKIYNAPSYDEAMYWASLSLLLVLNLTTPVTKWIDARNLGQFVRSWQDFQVNHINSELEMTMTVPLKIVTLLLIPTSAVFVLLETYLVTGLSFFVSVPFVTAFCESFASLLHWCVGLYELRAASRLLLSKIITAMDNGCRRMSTYRRTWLALSQLVAEVGEAHAVTGMMMYLLTFSSLVLSTYTMLSTLFSLPDYNLFWGLLVGTIIGFICIFIMCDAAHRTTQEVGSNISSKILALDLMHLSQGEINEITLLLQTMSAHPPLVVYLGFVTVNRTLFVSTISSAVTYLVVLIQFKTSPPINEIIGEAGE